jgi:histidine triad (HIT) family protein
MPATSCAFCRIVAGTEPASRIYADEHVTAFMTLHPSAPGECLIIPNLHVDHFTDLDDVLATRIMTLAQRIGRRQREAFGPLRVGYVVHGFGVAHAHLIIVPQHGPYDITSSRFAKIEDGRVVFRHTDRPTPDRATLDAQAALLAP